jgi:hypothetical protein
MLEADREAISILYGDCGESELRIDRVSVGKTRSDPLWEISSEGSAAREYEIGITPEGFTESIELESDLAPGRYLVVIDSSRLEDESYTFATSELSPGMVLVGDNELVPREQFEDAIEC